ncbi:MAG: sugar nucleotide-binding protein [Candidatus Chisholmbacteria bacterium]|nr:sugar nucleotide-binding protein [Candidatus Chisholmbacteria bacterium]
MVGSRFVEIYQNEFEFTNIDLATGIDITDTTVVNQALVHSHSSVCLHFAAFTDVNAAHQQQGDKSGSCYRINVLGTQNIAQACAATDTYLIHISTDFVFDGTRPPAGGYTEIDPPHPIEWYGQTKLWAEEEVQKSGANFCIARITYPFRAHFPPKLDSVRSIISKLKSKTLPPMFTDHILTPTFIDDIAQALKVIIDQKPTGIFHVVGSTNLSDYDLAIKVAQTFDLDASQIKPGNLADYLKANPRPYQKNLTTSNAKLRRDLRVTMSPLPAALLAMKRQLH